MWPLLSGRNSLGSHDPSKHIEKNCPNPISRAELAQRRMLSGVLAAARCFILFDLKWLGVAGAPLEHIVDFVGFRKFVGNRYSMW